MAIMTYDEWFKANGNKGNWGGYQQYVMKQGGGKVTRQEADGGKEAKGWSGEGMPDSSGLRAWAKKHGFREDFDRFDERTLTQWKQHMDERCPPHAPFRAINGTGCVEKPIDTNYNARNAQYLGVQPAKEGTWVSPTGEVRGGGGGPAPMSPEASAPAPATPAPATPAPAPVEPVKVIDPLQQRLIDLASTRGGFFANDRDTGAASFGNGGVWTWGGMNPQQNAARFGNQPKTPTPLNPNQNAAFPGGNMQNQFGVQQNPVQQNPFQQGQAGGNMGQAGGNPFFTQQPQVQNQSDQFVGGMSTNPLKRKLFDVYGKKTNSPFG